MARRTKHRELARRRGSCPRQANVVPARTPGNSQGAGALAGGHGRPEVATTLLGQRRIYGRMDMRKTPHRCVALRDEAIGAEYTVGWPQSGSAVSDVRRSEERGVEAAPVTRRACRGAGAAEACATTKRTCTDACEALGARGPIARHRFGGCPDGDARTHGVFFGETALGAGAAGARRFESAADGDGAHGNPGALQGFATREHAVRSVGARR